MDVFISFPVMIYAKDKKGVDSKINCNDSRKFSQINALFFFYENNFVSYSSQLSRSKNIYLTECSEDFARLIII